MKNLKILITLLLLISVSSAEEDLCKKIKNISGYKYTQEKTITPDLLGSAQVFEENFGGINSTSKIIFGDIGIKKEITTLNIFTNYRDLWVYAKSQGTYKEFTQKFFIFFTARYPNQINQETFDKYYFLKVKEFPEDKQERVREILEEKRDSTLRAFSLNNMLNYYSNKNKKLLDPFDFFSLIFLNKFQTFDDTSLRDKTTNKFMGYLIEGKIKEAYEIIMNINTSKEFSGVYNILKENCKI